VPPDWLVNMPPLANEIGPFSTFALFNVPAMTNEPLLAIDTPTARTLLPVSTQLAPLSIVIRPKSMYLVPNPDKVPVEAPEANSSVLRMVEPTVLPPSTKPLNTAPGSMIRRLAKPVAKLAASETVPEIVPALVSVPAPPK